MYRVSSTSVYPNTSVMFTMAITKEAPRGVAVAQGKRRVPKKQASGADAFVSSFCLHEDIKRSHMDTHADSCASPCDER